MSYDFVGHPLLQNRERSKIDINQVIGKNKALISVFTGSRKSEISVLMPILLNFIKLMNDKCRYDLCIPFDKRISELLQSTSIKVV